MSFTRGENPLFMDRYDGGYPLGLGRYWLGNRNDVELRKNLGYTRIFADRMNLAAASPKGELASSGYALVDPGMEYLVFVPQGGEVTVNLTGSKKSLEVEWFDPSTGESYKSSPADPGNEQRIFRAPFSGSAVLFLIASDQSEHGTIEMKGR
jgi:hypothetical protein